MRPYSKDELRLLIDQHNDRNAGNAALALHYTKRLAEAKARADRDEADRQALEDIYNAKLAEDA